jgi:hypothetical protein
VLDSAVEGAGEGVTEGAGADEAGGGADEAGGEAVGESGGEEAEETAAAVAVAESAGGAEETRGEGNVLALVLADMLRIARRAGSQAGEMKSRLDEDELMRRCGMRQGGRLERAQSVGRERR